MATTDDRRVTASLTISFSSTSSTQGGIILEVDDRDVAEGGLNGGNTSFKPGDAVYYLMYVSDNVTINQHAVTAGTKTSQASGTRVVTKEYVTFTDSSEGSLKYPASTGVTFTWIGNAIRTDGGSSGVTISLDNVGKQSVRLSGKVAGILRADYSASYQAFKLSNVPLDIDQVMIFVAGLRDL